jgi:DNA-directed RNA polymerase specialized sigma24 family protein
MALAEIYDTYRPGLYRYAMRLLGDASLAEDCVAETFARFLKALHTRQGPREHLQRTSRRTQLDCGFIPQPRRNFGIE